ncbi:Protein Networked [Sesbania bispinosa]|nr:Protein Networked [Sesbania bispinosa]
MKDVKGKQQTMKKVGQVGQLRVLLTHMFMEINDPESWSSSHIHQSQWLQTTISDLDEKLEAMMTILEGCNSPNQGHMHCKWREDLIKMLEEFGQSYRVLAIAYNQQKGRISHGTFHSGSLSSSGTSKTMCAICNQRAAGNLGDKNLEERCNRRPKSLAEHSDVKFDGHNLDLELLNKQEDEYQELLSADPCNMKFKSELERRDAQMEDRITYFPSKENVVKKIEGLESNQRIEDPSMINFKSDNMWLTLKYQIMKLTEDNLHQLVELVQRNDEKRETIKRLQLEVEALKRDNKALQTSLRHSNADSEWDQDQSQISRQGVSIGKLFRGCSP